MSTLCVGADLRRRRRLPNRSVHPFGSRRQCLRASAECGPNAGAHARADRHSDDLVSNGFAIATSDFLTHACTNLHGRPIRNTDFHSNCIAIPNRKPDCSANGHPNAATHRNADRCADNDADRTTIGYAHSFAHENPVGCLERRHVWDRLLRLRGSGRRC